MAEMELSGMDGLLARLQQMGSGQARAENKVLRAGAEVVQRAMAERAPRSRMFKRHMADFIVVSKVMTRDGMKYIAVGPQPGDNHEFFYSKFLEYGTSKMAARPFAGPAAAESKSEVIEAMKQALRKELGM